MSLDEAIAIARRQSVEALQAKQAFISAYWAYRSYRASRLPSLNLYGNIMNYDRSFVLLQSYEDGTMRYAGTYNLQNSVGISVIQNVALTGGKFSIYSDLSRIDQYGANKGLTWYSQPVTISYDQPFFAYNQFKWDKKIEPIEYEKGKREYLESMEEICSETVSAYFNLLSAEMKLNYARTNYENTITMLSIAGERLKIGSMTKDEYLHLELQSLKDSISINEREVGLKEAQMMMNSILGYDESVEIHPKLENEILDIQMDYDFVMNKAMCNSSFLLGNEIEVLNAESSVNKAKADRGVSMSLNASFGLSRVGDDMPSVYSDLLNQEVVGLTFSIPIFDWGLGKGKVQKARAAENVVKAKVQQSMNDYRRQVFTLVGQYNSQSKRCSASKRAMEIADERYMMIIQRFRNGNATVTELSNAQSDNDSARENFLSDLSDYWVYYYTLRKYTLYDFLNKRDLEVNAEEMVE